MSTTLFYFRVLLETFAAFHKWKVRFQNTLKEVCLKIYRKAEKNRCSTFTFRPVYDGEMTESDNSSYWSTLKQTDWKMWTIFRNEDYENLLWNSFSIEQNKSKNISFAWFQCVKTTSRYNAPSIATDSHMFRYQSKKRGYHRNHPF